MQSKADTDMEMSIIKKTKHLYKFIDTFIIKHSSGRLDTLPQLTPPVFILIIDD